MKNIFRFGRFILESVKDDIGEFGWKEIALVDYNTGSSERLATGESALNEPFTESDLYFFKQFANKFGLELSDTWNSGTAIKILSKDKIKFEIRILKKSDGWYYTCLQFVTHKPGLKSFWGHSYYIADQRDGLQNLLSEILENRVSKFVDRLT
jgi:hypothetical protein